MPDHRAEQILVAVESLCLDLNTIGSSVIRARVYPWDDEELPGLGIFMGADEPIDIESRNISFLDSQLTVTFEAACKKFDYAQIDTTLNQIRTEVETALYSTVNLGLDWVLDVIQQGAEEPELSGEGEKPAARQRFSFLIKYRRSLTDPRQ